MKTELICSHSIIREWCIDKTNIHQSVNRDATRQTLLLLGLCVLSALDLQQRERERQRCAASGFNDDQMSSRA